MQFWACLVEALCHCGPAELKSCKGSVLSLPLPGHPTLPQPCKGLQIPSASGTNCFKCCLPSGLQISVLLLA